MRLRIFAIVMVCFGIAGSAWIGLSADDSRWRALLLSGGGSPASNAVAHAKNIRFVRETLVRLGLEKKSIDIHISTGNAKVPDTGYYDTSRNLSWERGVLDRLLGRGLLDMRYRPHGIDNVDGSARYDEVKTALRKAAADLESGQTLLLYTTDHGQRNDADSRESYVVLWGRPDLSVADVRASLASGGDEGRVITVMAQCYSGAYANVIYADGVSEPAKQDRCGFFATLPDREAAGCTPELNEAEYDDFTTRLFAVLGRKTRIGTPAPDADYDRDGEISFAEGHAYAVGAEETIDVPLKTSEHYLETAGVSPAGDWDKALAAAPAPEKAAFEMLRKKLQIGRGNPISTATDALSKLNERIQAKTKEGMTVDGRLVGLEETLRFNVLERWPILDSPFDPDFSKTLKEDSDKIQAFFQQSPDYREWRKELEAYHGLTDEIWQLEVERAWWMRVERLAKHILRLAALPTQEPAVTAFHERLRTCEATVPGRSRP